MASLPDVTMLTLLLSAGTYGVYHWFEPAGLGSAGALLLAIPLYITLQARHLYSSAFWAFAFTFFSYYSLIIAYTITYRLSSFHPLAQYPGPVACKVSKLWMTFVVSRGYTHKYICELHNIYGDVVRTGPNELSFRDDKATITILKEVEKGPYYDCRNQKGVIPLDGIKSFHDHAIRRKLWNKAFNITSAKEHSEDLKSCVDELLHELDRKRTGVIDIAAWISFLSYDFMGHIVFGSPIGMVKAGRDFTGFAELADSLAYIANVISHIPWIWPFLQSIPNADAPLEIPRKVCKDLVSRRMKSNNTVKRDLYYYLLDEDGLESVKPDETVALMEGTTAIIAGSDTASTMMAHTLFFLMRHRSALKRVQAELDELYNGDGAHPDYTKNIETPYLSACINETMRVYPALLAALQRRVELGSGGKMIASHFVPEGTQVTASLFTMHRDPRHFSPIPETFWPDRWLSQETYVLPSGETIGKDDIVLNRSVYLPFSLGQQNCPGKMFANMEMKTVLSAILHTFDIKPAPGTNLDDYENSISDVYITHKGPLPVKLTARR